MLELGLIGLGGWGKRIVNSVQGKSDNVRIHSAIVSRPERYSDFAAQHDLDVGNDMARMLANPAIQGVISCGPAFLHAEHSLAALRAGKPVLAIKPMAKSAADAAQLQAAAEKSGVLLALGYDRCFFPNVAEMRKRLQSGVLGKLLHAEGNFCVNRYGAFSKDDWKANPQHVTAGSLADHMLYLMIETMGPVAQVHTMSTHDASANDLADTAAVLLRMANNTTGMLTAIGTTADYYRFQVFGTDGWMQIRGQNQLTWQPVSGPGEDLELPQNDAVRDEIEAFAAAIGGHSTYPVPVGDAVHSAAVLEAMDRSSTAGGPVSV